MYIPVSRAVIPHLQYTHHTGTRTGTFYKEAEDSEDVAALSDAFSDASGDLGTLDCIRYVGDTDFCIDHLQHTEAEVIVEDMGAFEEDGDLLITALDDADATFQERLHWSAPA